jgi:hypothetical protein
MVPSREKRDLLLTGVFGGDPQPARCQQHSDPQATRRDCAACRAFHLWRKRMHRRFNIRGLQYVPDPRPAVVDDPEPPRCPHPYASNRNTCPHCRARRNWKQRQYKRASLRGVATSFKDLDMLIDHVRRLRAGGLNGRQIAKTAQCGRSAVQRLLAGDRGERSYVQNDVAARLLAIPVPERKLRLVPDAVGAVRRQVDATGTRRRMQLACRAGHNIAAQARRLGYDKGTGYGWMSRPTVAIEVADAVAELFPTLLARPGGDANATAFAISKGWPAARYFSSSNIDDPGYEPFAIVAKPIGLWRRMRGLAWMGHGPEDVAAHIGEDPRKVRRWLEGPAPAYAAHRVDIAFDDLTAEAGPDDRLARRARRLCWSPPLAWYGIDIDNPMCRPRRGLPPGERIKDHPLESQIHLALLGRVTAAELLNAEKISVVRALHMAGWSDRRVGAWLRWNVDGDHDKAAEAVCTFRQRYDIRGGGPDRYGLNRADAQIIVPSAA